MGGVWGFELQPAIKRGTLTQAGKLDFGYLPVYGVFHNPFGIKPVTLTPAGR